MQTCCMPKHASPHLFIYLLNCLFYFKIQKRMLMLNRNRKRHVTNLLKKKQTSRRLHSITIQQMLLLNDNKFYLSNLPPVKTIKEVVCPPLISVGLQSGLHARCSCNPHSLLFMVPPVSVKAATCIINNITSTQNNLCGLIMPSLIVTDVSFLICS